MRVVFHEQDEAERVAARLRAEGWKAGLVRERFAGEDDDEDHAWAVLTDAPAFAVELYAEEYDAWVDEGADDLEDLEALDRRRAGDRADPGTPPMELPDAPRRIKRHFTD